MRTCRNGFLIGLAVAALTFGGLWLGLGSDHFNRGQKFCDAENCCIMEHHQHPCSEAKSAVQAPLANDSIAE